MKKIKLTQGKFALVDDDMYEGLSKFNWCLSSGYPVRGTSSGGARSYKMHRIIAGAKNGEIVDHIDGNILNNQRSNLRLVTATQNQMNRKLQSNNKSGFKGVTWCKRTGKWIAQIRVKTKTNFLGYYVDKLEAAKSYNEAAKECFGEFARLNKLA